MKRYLLSLCLLISSAIVFSQDPAFDTTTNNITGFSTGYLDIYMPNICSIRADGEYGQGLLVGPNLVLTSYSLIAGKSDVSYIDASGKTRNFDGYIVADPSRGIILLKTAELYSKFADLTSTFYTNTPSHWQQNIFLMHKRGNRVVIDKAILSRVDPYEEFIKRSYILREISYASTKSIQGNIDLNLSGGMAGMIVYIKGEPVHINVRLLYELTLFSDLTTKNLSYLPNDDSGNSNKKSKPAIYKIGMKTDSKDESEVTLDYVKRDQQKLSLYFTFKSIEWPYSINEKSYVSSYANTYVTKSGTTYAPILGLIDLKSGIIYHPSSTENVPTIVYNNTSSRANIHFDNIPPSVQQVKLYSLPKDVFDIRKSNFYEHTRTHKNFFSNLIIDNFPTTKKTHYALDENLRDEGTVSFYFLDGEKMTDDVTISINGNTVGKLDSYITNTTITDFCGRSGALTVKLKPGEYKYKAVMGSNKIERKFMITRGECLSQLIKF